MQHGYNRRWITGFLLAASVGCGKQEAIKEIDAAIPADTLAGVGEFSFFAVSLKFIKAKAPCPGTDGKTCLGGFGGDLRNGKTNGIDGADSLCAEAAQLANPGDRHQWRAFLSAGNYQGAVLNAIDRIGSGPWYSAPPKYQAKTNYQTDGLLVATDKAGLVGIRPAGDPTTTVYNGVNQSMGAGNAQAWPFSQCLLNEYGYCTQADGDTHDTLTGSKTDGTYAGSLAATCDDWTNNTKNYGKPAYGHTWPRQLNATDNAAQWINIGESLNACGAILNVTSTNYGNGSSTGGLPGTGLQDDGGFFPGAGMPGGPGDGGPLPPFALDGGAPFPLDFPDGGWDPSMLPPNGFDADPNAGNLGVGGMGVGTGDGTYAGGVGSSGGYGAFYCFAFITGAE